MRHTLLSLSGVLVVVLAFMPVACLADADIPDSAAAFGDSAVAKILDYREPIKLTGIEARSTKLGEKLHNADTIEISADGYCTLMFRDGTVRTYGGPKSVYFDSPQSGGRQNLLKKMAHSIVEIFFASNKSVEDTQLGTRTSLLDDPIDRVPRLVYPPDGTKLLEVPAFLKWRFVEGVTDYSVSVYQGNQLFLNINTTDTSLKIDPELCDMKPGAGYVWRVKAIVGDSCLRSRPSTFDLVDESKHSDISLRVKSIDDNISDDRLARLMKAQLYREMGFKLNCYWELESILAEHPEDAILLRAKADILYEMGLVEEALTTYRKLLD